MSSLVRVRQAVHGYRRGHRLLAGGQGLDDSELAILDRFSDLSGYLPNDVTFHHYFSGFPCGRFYAFTLTWPDHGAARKGTVATHSLLIRLEDLQFVDD